MCNAKTIPCDLLLNPKDKKYHVDNRKFQGCPTIAITPKGRIYAGWYAGGWCEPHIENYNLLVYSDDLGETWSEPLLVIPSSEKNLVHALDIQLWVSPEGKLHVFWVQNNVKVAKPGIKGLYVDGYLFTDNTHAEWVTVCDDPDSENPTFSSPRYLDKGFLRCKPLVLENGRWINFNYSQDDPRYQYSISDDNGATYIHKFGPNKKATPFDETMAYQKKTAASACWQEPLKESWLKPPLLTMVKRGQIRSTAASAVPTPVSLFPVLPQEMFCSSTMTTVLPGLT